LRNRKVLNLSNKKLIECISMEHGWKNVAIIMIIIVIYKIVLLFLFIQRLEDHRRQRSSFGRLGVPKLG